MVVSTVLYHISTSSGLSIGYCSGFCNGKGPRINRGPGCVWSICSLAALSVQGRPSSNIYSEDDTAFLAVFFSARGGLAQCHMAVLLYYSCICPWRIRIMLLKLRLDKLASLAISISLLSPPRRHFNGQQWFYPIMCWPGAIV